GGFGCTKTQPCSVRAAKHCDGCWLRKKDGCPLSLSMIRTLVHLVPFVSVRDVRTVRAYECHVPFSHFLTAPSLTPSSFAIATFDRPWSFNWRAVSTLVVRKSSDGSRSNSISFAKPT